MMPFLPRTPSRDNAGPGNPVLPRRKGWGLRFESNAVGPPSAAAADLWFEGARGSPVELGIDRAFGVELDESLIAVFMMSMIEVMFMASI